MAKGSCSCCGNEYNVNADGTVRYHLATDAECHESPDSRKCRGAGRPPAGAKAEPDGSDIRFLCRVPSGPEGCGHQVQLTANHRARSHLTPQGTPCTEGGSAFSIAVGPDGYRADTAEWTEEDWDRVFPKPLTLGDVFKDDARNATVTPRTTETIDLPHDRGTVPASFAGGPLPVPKPAPELFTTMASGSPLVDLLTAAVDNPGTVLDLFDPRDPNGPGEMPSAIGNSCTCTQAPGDFEGPAEDCPEHGNPEAIFDVTHRYTDPSGTEWIHPGEVADCRLPDCCTHPQGFEWGDDGNGHSGSVCMTCGAEEPEPCTHHVLESGLVDGRPVARCGNCWRPWAACEAENINAWRTPDDILDRMPGVIRAIAASNPECWDCEHEVTPLAERFEPSGKVQNVIWDCHSQCAHNTPGHIGVPCRPRLSCETTVGELEVGTIFTRSPKHSGALRGLVYRTQAVTDFCVQAMVISAGAHSGRTGELTNLAEEVTCTDINGVPRPRPQHLPESLTGPQPILSLQAPKERPRTQAPKPVRSSTPATTATASTAPARSKRATSSGASAPVTPASSSTPSASTSGAPVPDAFSTPKAAKSESDKYDRYGRYKLTHPDSPKKKVNWTRATTFAKSIQDTFALSQWAQRMALKGAALRSDIVAAAGTLEVKADKDRLNALVEDAKKAAGAKVAANLGTAMHTYTERHDKGEATQAPEEHQPAVDAYAAVLESFGLEPVPGLIEFTTAVKQYEIAGTSDRCYRVTRDITIDLNGRPVTLYAGEYVIGDVKTGADLSYGWQEIAIQLAIYAQGLNTSGVWSWDTGTWSRPVDPDQPGVQIQVRTDVGVVPHLPVDRSATGAPLATLYAVDISAGWAAAVLCASVRDWRRSSKLAVPLTVADVVEDRAVPVTVRPDAPAAVSRPAGTAPAPVVTDREPTLEDRAQAVRNRAEASAVYQAAVAAKVPMPRLNALVKAMQDKLRSHVEQGA